MNSYGNDDITYEVVDTDHYDDNDEKPPARSVATAPASNVSYNNGQQRQAFNSTPQQQQQQPPAASLLGAERDLRAKQDARAHMTSVAARPPSNSRLMQMEEDALSKARGGRATSSITSIPGAVTSMPPPASLQAVENDLQSKITSYSSSGGGRSSSGGGYGSVVNPSVAAATAAARRAAQEQAAAAAAAASSSNKEVDQEPLADDDEDDDYHNQDASARSRSNASSSSAAAPTSSSRSVSERPMRDTSARTAESAWSRQENEEDTTVSAVSRDRSMATTTTTTTSPPVLVPTPVQQQAVPTVQMAAFQSQGSFDDSTDNMIVDASPIEAFVAESDMVVDAAGVAVVLDEEEEKQLEDRKVKRLLRIGCIGVFILILAIVVPTTLLLGKESKHEIIPTMSPSQVPSMVPSFTPTAVYFTTLESQFVPLSGSAVFQDRSSPQYAAVKWMTEFESRIRSLTGEAVQQLYFMAVFYFAMNGENWKSCNRKNAACNEGASSISQVGWLSNAKPCTWYVVSCGESSTVEVIQFNTPNAAGLSGSLPLELFLLTSLKTLFINSEAVSGTIPAALSKLSNMGTLVLPNNLLTGPIPATAIGKLTKLKQLFLQGNDLNSTVPSTLGLLPLNDLRISDNALTGTIPTEIGQISSLGIFYANLNHLSGEVPKELFSPVNISAIGINGNELLSGTIPSSIGALTKMVELNLGFTNMNGTIPEGMFSLTSLTSLRLNNASFSGTLSDNFGNLNVTQILDLSYNKFHGAIPTTFALLGQITYLYLQGNDLTGFIATPWCNRTGYLSLKNATVDCDKVDCKCCQCP